jgi:hypothetical protein
MTPLTVHTAEITTAAVEIKTLTIRGKQVTLAVFRQLQHRELIATDGTLNGVPWGTVNYHPDKRCADRDLHWHIVWQDGNDLYRGTVDQQIDFNECLQTDAANHFISACVARELAGGGHDYFGGSVGMEDNYRKTLRVSSAPEVTVWAKLLDAVRNAYDAAYRMRSSHAVWENSVKQLNECGWKHLVKTVADNETRYETKKAEAAEAVAEPGFNEYLASAVPDDWYQMVEAEAEAEQDRRQRHWDVRVALGDLPQLFIAV